MAEQYVFSTYKLGKSYGPKQVIKDISLSFLPGAKIGIVGQNGSGKSTLLRIMALQDHEFQGHAEAAPGIRVCFVPQEPALAEELTVRQHLEQAFSETLALISEYEKITESMGDMDPDAMDAAMERMGKLQEAIEACDGWELETRLRVAANALVLPPDDMPVRILSGGERRRVALCRALLEQPDLLLLDEPTNHLDAETVAWLETYLKEYPGTVIISTHDRYFLDNITRWILELEDGLGLPFEGNYSSWLEQKISILAEQEKKESPRRRSLDRELKWIRMTRRDHRDLSQSRLSQYETLLAKESNESRADAHVIQIAPAPALGDSVVAFHNVTMGFNGSILMKEASFVVPRGAVVGIVGPNGTGKTTLFRLIARALEPLSGRVEVGETVKLAWADQLRETVNVERTVYEEISDGEEAVQFGSSSIPARAYCGRFGFRGQDQQKLVKNLSGGEQNRVHLAKTLKIGGNVLLLDEPTNDLDVGTLRGLEDAIEEFSGCVLVISHDRFFLNRICTHLLVFEGEGRIRFFIGNFEEYQETRAKEPGGISLENRRARYRPFTLS